MSEKKDTDDDNVWAECIGTFKTEETISAKGGPYFFRPESEKIMDIDQRTGTETLYHDGKPAKQWLLVMGSKKQLKELRRLAKWVGATPVMVDLDE